MGNETGLKTRLMTVESKLALDSLIKIVTYLPRRARAELGPRGLYTRSIPRT